MKRIATLLLGTALAATPLVFAQETAQQEKAEKSATSGGPAEPSAVWSWVNFAGLVGLLGYLAVKQGGPFFNSRAATIRKGIDEAEKIKADSDAKVSAINSKLGRLDAEIASLRENAGAERRAAEQRLKDEAEREIQRITAQAEGEIDTAGKSERVALQRYAAKLALELAETKVRARMNPNAEDALVQAFVKGLAAQKPSPQTHD